jgi:hypothetical protein
MTNSGFKEAFGRLERIPGAPRVTSGSSAVVVLEPPKNLGDLQTISAIESLARRGVHVPLAKAVIEDLVRQPSHPASVYVPHVESQPVFSAEMAANGVHVVFAELVTRSDL